MTVYSCTFFSGKDAIFFYQQTEEWQCCKSIFTVTTLYAKHTSLVYKSIFFFNTRSLLELLLLFERSGHVYWVVEHSQKEPLRACASVSHHKHTTERAVSGKWDYDFGRDDKMTYCGRGRTLSSCPMPLMWAWNSSGGKRCQIRP